MKTLTLKPYGERVVDTTYIQRRIEFETGAEQVQLVTPNPKKIWELKYQGTEDWMNELQFFFDQHKGGKKFYWVDHDGNTHIVRFANDSLKINQRMGWSDGKYGVQSFEATIQLRKIWGAS